MTYIVILSALFLVGIFYIVIAGAGIIRDDDQIVDQQLAQLNKTH
ncbi:hypothetical protein MHI37_12200 [Paenibacillus sp. FSL H8-0548]|nr:hypothetical protein [Paenibacillus sp. FSL H8-0548]